MVPGSTRRTQDELGWSKEEVWMAHISGSKGLAQDEVCEGWGVAENGVYRTTGFPWRPRDREAGKGKGQQK